MEDENVKHATLTIVKYLQSSARETYYNKNFHIYKT